MFGSKKEQEQLIMFKTKQSIGTLIITKAIKNTTDNKGLVWTGVREIADTERNVMGCCRGGILCRS
jgi:hypothetical protein